MADRRIHLWLIQFIGLIVPRRLRADWRHEWEAELHWRTAQLAQWDKLDWRNKLDLLWRSLGAFADALALQPRRMEDEMIQDIRYGLRMLLKHRGFTFIAVLTLALGIGASTAIFSMASATLWRPLLAPQPEEIVEVFRGEGMSGNTLSYPDYLVMRERADKLAGLAVSAITELVVSNGEQSRMISGELVSGNYFELLGIRPMLGRAFLPEEDRVPDAHPVVVLSHDFWQRQYNGDPQLVGKTITLNRRDFTVIGIGPAEFTGTSRPFAMSVWMPMMMIGQTRSDHRAPLNERDHEFAAIARLKPGVTPEAAKAQLEMLNRQLELAHPLPANRAHNTPAERALNVVRAQGLIVPLRPLAKTATALLATVVGMIWLIACANVANLLLARASARSKEIAVRSALGAGRGRLLRQLLVESLLLSLLGATVGLLFALWLNGALMALEPPVPAAWNFQLRFRLDWQALSFTLAVAIVTSLLFGLAPALHASKPDLVSVLKDAAGAETRRGRWHWFNLRNALVISQIAVSLVLLIGAGLFVRSLSYAQKLELGFNTTHRHALSLNLSMQGYDEAKGQAFVRQAVERLSSLPGVVSAGAANTVPLGVLGVGEQVAIEGRHPLPNDRHLIAVENQLVTPGYLTTLGTALLRGRQLDERDNETASRVALISEGFARRHFANEDPLGKRLHVGSSQAPPVEIVGIVQDVAFQLGGRVRPVVYRPLAQSFSSWVTLVMHTAGASSSLIPEARRAIQSLDSHLPVQEIKTLEEIVGLQLWPVRTLAGLVTGLGLLGLILATVGIYGVMSYAVAQRTREIGIRMALGAQTSDVLRLVVRHGLGLTLFGTAIGLSLAFAVTRLLASLLYGVSAHDPFTFIGVPLLLAATALLAAYLPARRATQVDPLIALRHE